MSYIGVSAAPTPAGVYTKAETETRLNAKLSTEGGELTGGLTVTPPIGESFVKLKSNTVGATSEVMLRGSDNDGFDTAYNSTLDQFRISRYVNDVYQNSPVVVDSAGRVTMPYQPCFHGRTLNTVTWAQNALYAPDDAVINIGNHFNTTTGLFTAPVSGIYQLTGTFLPGSGGSATYLNIFPRVNGSNVTVYGSIYGSASTEINVAGTFHISLNANDTLGFGLSNNGTQKLYGTETFMSIRLVG